MRVFESCEASPADFDPFDPIEIDDGMLDVDDEPDPYDEDGDDFDEEAAFDLQGGEA